MVKQVFFFNGQKIKCFDSYKLIVSNNITVITEDAFIRDLCLIRDKYCWQLLNNYEINYYITFIYVA